MNTERKLIFFDIDGTIVTEARDGRIIPDSTRTALRKLQQNGHLCFINTGRALAEIDELILQLQMDGLVCGCGTYITYHDNVLAEHTIPFDLGNRILAALHDCNLEWILESTGAVYYSSQTYHSHIGDFKEEQMGVIPNLFLVAPQDAHDLTFDKFCICDTPGSDTERFLKMFEHDLTFIDRGNGFYEVVPMGYSKASGMQFLMDHFAIAKVDTIAIGDSTNDLPMLSYAGTGIAMGGSAASVLDAADFETDTILQDGLYNAFRYLQLV